MTAKPKLGRIAAIKWNRNGQPFMNGKYSRDFSVAFVADAKCAISDTAAILSARGYRDSAILQVLKMHVVTISASHMLHFLYAASSLGIVIDQYEDRPESSVRQTSEGIRYLDEVLLHPAIKFSGDSSHDPKALDTLHARALQESIVTCSSHLRVSVCARDRVS